MNGLPPLPLAASGTRTSAVYAQLRHDIVHNRLRAGEKLRVESLAERYGVGATPLREALNRLSAEGLVSQQDQKGFRVTPISRQDLLELTRTRAWVTEILLRESIARGDEAWEEGIVLAMRRLSRVPQWRPEEPTMLNPAWEKLHRAFHDALVAACPSPMLLEFQQRLFDAADRYRNVATGQQESTPRDVQEEHLAQMEAALARRADEAIRLANDHTARTAETLLQLLRVQEEGGSASALRARQLS